MGLERILVPLGLGIAARSGGSCRWSAASHAWMVDARWTGLNRGLPPILEDKTQTRSIALAAQVPESIIVVGALRAPCCFHQTGERYSARSPACIRCYHVTCTAS
jgi:hypothetical protein